MDPYDEVHSAILSWVATFENLKFPAYELLDLKNGALLAQIFKQISPTYIDLTKINYDAETPSACLKNLNYLHQMLQAFYEEVLERDFGPDYVDLTKISNHENLEELVKLIELVLGAAVQCENKEDYITMIMNLDESYQAALMLLIEKILNKCNNDNIDAIVNAADKMFESASNRVSLLLGNSNSIIIKENEKKANDYLAAIDNLEKENNDLQAKVKDLESERKELSQKATELKVELDKRDEENKKLKFRNAEIEDKVVQESQGLYQNEIKLRDIKINELNKYIEEINRKHEMDLNATREERDEQQKKIHILSKLEGTVEFYKTKYEEFTKLVQKLSEYERDAEEAKIRDDDNLRNIKILQTKLESTLNQLNIEKEKNITFEIDILKRNKEIEDLKNEKKRLEQNNEELEYRVEDLTKKMERLNHEKDDAMNVTHPSLKQTQLGSDFLDIINSLERENEALKKDRLDGDKLSIEKEFLERDNQKLISRLKESELENSKLKEMITLSEGTKIIDKLNIENNRLREEIEVLKKNRASSDRIPSTQNLNSEDAFQEPTLEDLEFKKKLSETLEVLKNRTSATDVTEYKSQIEQKDNLIKELSHKITELEVIIQKAKKIEEDMNSKDSQIKNLMLEIESFHNIISDYGLGRDEEMKLMFDSIQELIIRNDQLESELVSIKNNQGLKT